MNGPIIINAPCVFIRVEVRRTTDGRDIIESAEVVRTESLANFFGDEGLADWMRRLNEGTFDRRRY